VQTRNYVSGSAGSVVASRLAEDASTSILLIEAGGDPDPLWDIPSNAGSPIMDEFSWNWNNAPSETACRGMNEGQCKYHRNKALGGCSDVNMMLYARGNSKDYDEWAEQGNEGWSYEDVLPFFKKSEDFLAYPLSDEQSNNTVDRKYHGTGGPLSVNIFQDDLKTAEMRKQLKIAAAENGLNFNNDCNGAIQTGITDLPVTVDQDFLRDNTAKAFLQNAPDNLKICKYSMVDKVILSSKKAVAVEFSYKNEIKTVYARKKIVLSAGAFNTPGILERSGIGNPSILEKHGIKLNHALPGVGENLQDHYYLAGNFYYADFHPMGPPNMLSTSISSFGGFVDSLSFGPVPDIMFVFSAIFKVDHGVTAQYTNYANFNKSLAAYYSQRAEKGDILSILLTVLKPGEHFLLTEQTKRAKSSIRQDREFILSSDVKMSGCLDVYLSVPV